MIRLTRRNLLFGLSGLAVSGVAYAGHPGRDEFEGGRRELQVKNLDPDFDGLRIAHLTDLHVGAATPDGRVISAIRAVNQEKPDLVLLTGDYVTWSKAPMPRLEWLLGGLSAPTFAVLGNHDHWVDADGVRRHLEGHGYCVLRNAWTEATVRGRPVSVIGIDDGRTGRDDVEKSFKGVPLERLRLVMAHTPPTADKLPAWQDLVCFAGHTHGGQLQVPRRTDSSGRRVGQPYLRGLYQVRGNQLYVNSGLGYGPGGLAVRLNAPAEVAFLTLRPV